jgi:argininosuccinate lyase
MTLWSGRFSESMDNTLWELSQSFSFDHVLYAYDIAGSKAHAEGLAKVGLLSAEELAAILDGLDLVTEEFSTGTFVRTEVDEDIHMAIERRLTELVGEPGQKLHTARSRNDQVATTLRLYTRDALTQVAQGALALVDALIAKGSEYSEAVLPGYTHLQRAQPVLLSHHLNAHAIGLLRDVDRCMDARDRMNVSPLGSGAIAGTSLPVDPNFTASLLGFDSAFINSMDAVSDRDFVAEGLFALALLGVHLSRLGEEIVLWTTQEFNFAKLSDAFTTGSSMLPHKKNSDVAELARGKSGRLVGNLTSVLVMLKGLPFTYNRDLQEDKEPLFDSVRTSLLVLRSLTRAISSMTMNVERMKSASGDELLVAIDIAEALVGEGVPFRVAHEVAGRAVGEAIATGQPLSHIVAQNPDLRKFAHLFAEGVALANRTSPGAAGPKSHLYQGKQIAQLVVQATARVAKSR